jgi:hypothetical protein
MMTGDENNINATVASPTAGDTAKCETTGSQADASKPALAEVFVQQYEAASETDDYFKIDFYEGDDDRFDPDGVTADEIARLRWSADYGMPTGDGWWTLVGFPDGSAVTLRGGDDASDPEVESLPEDEEARARAIATWCDVYAPLAALHLEPLDPNGTLTGETRRRWESAISEAPSYLHVHSTGQLGDLVREALSSDGVYARIRAAMADPTTEDARLCLLAIEFLQVGPNELCTGQWEDLDSE